MENSRALIPSSLRREVTVAAGVGAALVLPFVLLEAINREGFFASFPFVLFGVMWLLPAAFVLTVKSLTHGEKPGHLLGLVSRVALSMLIAWFWMQLVIDQMPCFLGVPNCD